MSYRTSSASKKSKKVTIIALLVILVVGAGLAYGIKTRNHNSTSASPDGQETINLAPATDQEKQENDANKQRIVDEQNNQNNNPPQNNQSGDTSSTKQVSVTITSADKSVVYAQVSGIVEDGGTCMATFTKGSTSLSASSDSIANVSYTQCAPIHPSSPLQAGNWSVVVSYKSTHATGSSAAFAFTVQ